MVTVEVRRGHYRADNSAANMIFRKESKPDLEPNGQPIRKKNYSSPYDFASQLMGLDSLIRRIIFR